VNIRERLAQAYGERQSMDTRSPPEGGYTVIIEIPHPDREQSKVAA
jgi:sensor histidine kinase YesM